MCNETSEGHLTVIDPGEGGGGGGEKTEIADRIKASRASK